MMDSYAAQLGLRRTNRKKWALLALVLALGVVAIVKLATPAATVRSADALDLRRPAPASSQIAVSSDYGHPDLVGLLKGSWLSESSGLTRSAVTGRLWTHNDSGDGAKIYCITESADFCGTWRVPGARAIDWEAISVGPGPAAGVSYLFAADIGDNELDRSHVTIYRFVEPDREGGGVTETPVAIQLRYPDGAHNAEGMFVHPETGALFIITKEPSGGADVYSFSGPARSGVNELEKVAVVRSPGLSSVTAADISPDGSRVILGTYGAAFEFIVPARFDAVWDKKPAAVGVGLRIQGEALAYSSDGSSLFSTSEMSPTPLYKTARRN